MSSTVYEVMSFSVYEVMSFSVHEVTRFHTQLEEQKYLQTLFCNQLTVDIASVGKLVTKVPQPRIVPLCL